MAFLASTKQMFRDVLPEHVLNDLQKQHITTTREDFNWVNSEIGRLSDSLFPTWNMMRLVQQLKPKGSTSVNRAGAEEPAPPTEHVTPPVQCWESIQANMERMIAAALARNDQGRSNSRTPQGRETPKAVALAISQI